METPFPKKKEKKEEKKKKTLRQTVFAGRETRKNDSFSRQGCVTGLLVKYKTTISIPPSTSDTIIQKVPQREEEEVQLQKRNFTKNQNKEKKSKFKSTKIKQRRRREKKKNHPSSPLCRPPNCYSPI